MKKLLLFIILSLSIASCKKDKLVKYHIVVEMNGSDRNATLKTNTSLGTINISGSSYVSEITKEEGEIVEINATYTRSTNNDVILIRLMEGNNKLAQESSPHTASIQYKP